MERKSGKSHKLLHNLTARNLKSQAALEFLTTYAWALLVISITIGALYYFGIFNFSKYLPQRCLFSSQFECIDFSFVDTEVRLKLYNGIGETIMVTDMDITNDAVSPLTCTSPAVPFSWTSDLEMDFVFSGCQDGAFIVGERTDAKITLTYYAVNTPSQPLHQVNGKITAFVNSP